MSKRSNKPLKGKPALRIETRGKAGASFIGELVYEDRPWPTPESTAAMRRFLLRYLAEGIALREADRPDPHQDSARRPGHGDRKHGVADGS